MKVTGIELLQKIKDNEIKEGFKIQCTDDWNGVYEFDGFDFKTIDTNVEIWNRYSVNEFIITEFKILEENKEIEELKILDEGDYNSKLHEYISKINRKTNELVRAYNKLIKESEEK